ncbi:MAG: hypothetical protein R3E66_19750 [bacterium]
MQLRLLTLAAASIGAVAGFFLSVGFWSIQEWAKPLEPMTYLGVALLIVYAVLVGAWVSVTRKDAQNNPGDGETARTRSFKRLVALMFQVLVGVVALLVSSLWALDGVRVTTLELFKDRGPLLYVQALTIRALAWPRKACELAL